MYSDASFTDCSTNKLSSSISLSKISRAPSTSTSSSPSSPTAIISLSLEIIFSIMLNSSGTLHRALLISDLPGLPAVTSCASSSFKRFLGFVSLVFALFFRFQRFNSFLLLVLQQSSKVLFLTSAFSTPWLVQGSVNFCSVNPIASIPFSVAMFNSLNQVNQLFINPC